MPEGNVSMEICRRQEAQPHLGKGELIVDVDFMDESKGHEADAWRAVRPAEKRLRWWQASEDSRWYEFHRSYIYDLRVQLGIGERLRAAAIAQGLVLTYALGTPQRNPAVVLRDFILELECQRRYDRGWFIGGYTKGVRDQILDLGGLYYQHHKVWVMPSAEVTKVIRKLFPGDF